MKPGRGLAQQRTSLDALRNGVLTPQGSEAEKTGRRGFVQGPRPPSGGEEPRTSLKAPGTPQERGPHHMEGTSEIGKRGRCGQGFRQWAAGQLQLVLLEQDLRVDGAARGAGGRPAGPAQLQLGVGQVLLGDLWLRDRHGRPVTRSSRLEGAGGERKENLQGHKTSETQRHTSHRPGRHTRPAGGAMVSFQVNIEH